MQNNDFSLEEKNVENFASETIKDVELKSKMLNTYISQIASSIDMRTKNRK